MKTYIIKVLILTLFTIYSVKVKAQTDGFKPYGKPVFLLFSDVRNSFSKEGSSTGFEITRLYLGYEHFFSDRFSARALVDVGDPGVGNLQMTAFVKNAFLQYRSEKLSARFGMISTDQYNLIDRQWGYRYISKTLQDEYGLGPSADLGAGIEYSPSKIVSFDASVLNGEGFRKIQADSVLKYTVGMTLRPAAGLIFRGYTDLMKKDYAQNTISLFAGYTAGSFNTGLEFSTQSNNRMVNEHDFSGIMFYTSLKIDKFSILARYDKLWSSKPDEITPWNYSRDGQLFMAGFDYSPVQGVRVGPVYRGWLPDDSSKSFLSSIGIYFELKL